MAGIYTSPWLYISREVELHCLCLLLFLSAVFCAINLNISEQFSWLQPCLEELNILFTYLFIAAKGLQQREARAFLIPSAPPTPPHLAILLSVPNINISAVQKREQSRQSASQFADQFITERGQWENWQRWNRKRGIFYVKKWHLYLQATAPEGDFIFHTGNTVYPNKLPVAAYITHTHMTSRNVFILFFFFFFCQPAY